MTHAVRILLDCREPQELIERFIGAAAEEEVKIPIKVQRLDLGDFIVEVDGIATTLVERKTWDDLWNSIEKGRFEHQRARYINAMIDRPGLNVFYVIEGDARTVFNNTKKKQVAMTTAIENLTTIHHIGCRYTSSITKTVELLLRTARKLAKCGAPEYINPASLKEAKGTKAGITSEDWWPTALSRIPGVTFETASVIAERFPSQESLLANASKLCDLERRPSSKKRKVDKKSTDKIAKPRRVGEKLAEKIVKFTTPRRDKEVTFETASVISERFSSQSLLANASKPCDPELQSNEEKRKMGNKLTDKIPKKRRVNEKLAKSTTPQHTKEAKKGKIPEIIELD